MATYKSPETVVNASRQTVYDRLSNLENLKNFIDNVPADRIPDDKRAMLEQITVTPTSISIPGGPVGSITLEQTRCVAPELVELTGVGTPVPLHLSLHLAEDGADRCKAQVVLDIEIPAMLKPMVGGTLQKMVDQFSTLLTAFPF